VALALTCLERYHKGGDEFFSHIITDDETWVLFVNVETKNQLRQWMSMRSPNKPEKFK
jgi:hypothetical protein